MTSGRAVMAWPAGAENSGSGAAAVPKATFQAALLAALMSNFHSLPYRSPAYTVSATPLSVEETTATPDRPFGVPALPDWVSMRTTAPVSTSTSSSTAWPLALL